MWLCIYYSSVTVLFFLILCYQNPIPMEGKDNAHTPSEEQGNEPTSYATQLVGDYMPLHPSGRSWEINREQVNIIKVIGKGAFSQVAQATVRDMRGKQEDITVAVKMLKGELLVIVVTIYYFY